MAQLMKTTFPARIHVVMARQAEIAVVFRRGPSKLVCTLLWDLQSDHFKVGQWLKGRIYERRADLSPDGNHLIYFAMNGKWHSKVKGSWTAVSKAPYLKAVSLFPKGECWDGGGLFTSNDTFWLNDGFGQHTALTEAGYLLRDRTYSPDGRFGNECLSVYYPRLLRDGWVLKEQNSLGRWNSESVFEKQHGSGWTLRKTAHEQVGHPPGKGCYWDEHVLLDEFGVEVAGAPSWEWAEFHHESVVFAEQGCLYRWTLSGNRKFAPKSLVDLNGMHFEPIEAPY